MQRQATRPLLSEQARLLVPVPSPAWQVHPGNKVEVGRVVHVGEVEQPGNLRLPKRPNGRRNLSEFIITGHAVMRIDRRAGEASVKDVAVLTTLGECHEIT
jgi:hypothetical protein